MHLLSRLMVTPLDPTRVWTTLSAFVALSCSSGSSPRAPRSRCTAKEGGSTAIDDEWAQRAMENVGAWILGRNMFGPVRGSWPDESWKGWWGEEPPYHVPTFVLTHHPRKSVEMKGGTTFHFVTDGIQTALQCAKDVAKERDVRIGGGVATIKQYLSAKLIDELHLAFRPILMGSGENLFAGMDMTALGYRCTQSVSTEHALHVLLTKQT